MKYDSKEYRLMQTTAAEAKLISKERSRYTRHVADEDSGPWVGEIPRTPNKEEWAAMRTYTGWMKDMKARTDSEWFDAVGQATPQLFYRSFALAIMYWELCDRVKLDREAWNDKMEDYDHDDALFADFDVLEQVLFDSGVHPTLAGQLATQAIERKRWRVNRLKIFMCRDCGKVMTDLDNPPARCSGCFRFDSMEEL